MKIANRFHLTYCSNIHPGESWQDVSDVLRTSLPRVRALLRFDGPFAVGLRLSAAAAAALEAPAALAAFQTFLADGDYYVPTINGFPYGAFHGERVKERVYLPDWRNPARLDYSNRLARLLAALLDGRRDIVGSVSTVPGAFRREVRSASDEDAIASNILRHAAHLVALRQRTGATITLALEPEPACLLETVADAVAFFERALFRPDRIQRVALETGVNLTMDDVRRHVGLCLDACHMAVEFEDPADAVAAVRDAGVRVCKVQVSSALRLADWDGAALAAALAPFAEDTYLHQVVEHDARGFTRYTDLPEALDAVARSTGAREWRVHFHVPIFLETIATFVTTQPYLASLIDVLKREDVCPYLEVETYTWDVLPPEHRTSDVCTAIARELTWARTTLEA
jgi:sugar phosphate isomerase/epimerase